MQDEVFGSVWKKWRDNRFLGLLIKSTINSQAIGSEKLCQANSSLSHLGEFYVAIKLY